jgi:hypothetical protein
MTRTRHDTSPQAQAIRAAGFVRVPGGLWLTKEDRDLVMFLAEKHLREINRIKEQVKELEDRRWQE